MKASLTLKARSRSEQGTRACRKLRQQGEIPANLYGADKSGKPTKLTNHALAVSAYEMMQLIDHHVNVMELKFDGKTELALIKEVQRDVFGDDVLHVDLEMIDASKVVQVSVEIVFKGNPQGVKDGGRMQIDLHELEIECLPNSIPQSIEVRVESLALGQLLHVSEVKLPEGVKALTPADQSVVQVVQATEEEGVDEEGAEPGSVSEPEVIGRKKEDGEGEDDK